ncbi:MAG: hypothetical protein P8X55_04670, partial [Desulfosarcinaceae bacterium]
IFEDIPFPILAVDHEAVVMLGNKMAFDLFPKLELKIGSPLCFPSTQDMQAVLSRVIESGAQQQVEVRTENGRDIKAQFSPFSGSYRGKGAIITLSP